MAKEELINDRIFHKPDLSQIDFTKYLDKRLSDEQVKRSTTLIQDDDLETDARLLLEQCNEYWTKLEHVREKSFRASRYYRGEQWGDMIVDPDTGELISEEQHIKNQGKVPLKQNQIRQVIKNLIGQFRDNDNTSTVVSRQRENQKVGEMLSNALSSALQINDSKELDVRIFEKFLLSGIMGWKTSYGWHSDLNVDDVEVDPVHEARLFFNTGITDIRLKELHTVGEILDVPLDEVIRSFAKNEADRQLIKDWYGQSGEDSIRSRYSHLADEQDSSIVENLDFYISDDQSKCRVIEVWQKRTEKVLIVHDRMTSKVYESDEDIKALEAENAQRIEFASMQGVPAEAVPLIEWEEKYEGVWYFWFLTPWGNILQHGRTPYDHEQTPYTLGLFPLVDGEIFGLVQDIIDQQRQINRLLTLHDFIVSSSAKGVLMIPEESIPDGWTEEDFADQWVRANGVIVYKSKPGINKPEQISANSTNIGTMEALQIQFNLLKEISGVTDAIQGHRPNSGTPSSLYAQQTHNASLSNRDFFEFFFSIKKKRDFKIVKLIQQFYDDERYINISGKDYSDEVDYYNPELAKDVDFNMTMGQSNTSNAYRQILDEWLGKFLEAGHIDFDTFLENTSMPFADKLREAVHRKQDELMAMQQQGMQADPQTMAMFQQAMGGQQRQQPAA